MVDLDPAPRVLAFLLGLGDLNRPAVCHGYRCGCQCEDCLERARLVRDRPPAAVRQPWEVAA